MSWAKTGAIQYHAQLRFLEKGCASQSVGCLKGDWMLDTVIIKYCTLLSQESIYIKSIG